METVIQYEILRRLIPENIDLILLETVDSTNNFAMNLARKGHPNDTVVIAREQSGGKGTKGRSFFSPRDSGLYLSVLMRTGHKLEDLLPPTPAAAVAAKRAVEEVFRLKPQIKWVNDIQIDGKKICGILAESVIEPSSGNARIVIGAGTNITTESFPKELRDKAAAIGEYTTKIDINGYAAQLANNLFSLAKAPDPKIYLAEYKRDSSVLGRMIEYAQNGEKITGKAIDFTEEGHLVLDVGGQRIIVFSGDVSIAVA